MTETIKANTGEPVTAENYYTEPDKSFYVFDGGVFGHGRRVICNASSQADQAMIVRALNSRDALLLAAKRVLAHPHVRAYLPYDPNDADFRALLDAVKLAEGGAK